MDEADDENHNVIAIIEEKSNSELIEEMNTRIRNLEKELEETKYKKIIFENKERLIKRKASDNVENIKSKKQKLENVEKEVMHELIDIEVEDDQLNEKEKEITKEDALLEEHIHIIIENVVEQLMDKVIMFDLKEQLKKHINNLKNIMNEVKHHN